MTELPSWIRQTTNGFEIHLHVQPRAKRSEIFGIHDGALKLKIAAPPVDDAANRAVMEFFASLLDIPKSCFSIVSGMKSKNKTLSISRAFSESFLEKIQNSRRPE